MNTQFVKPKGICFHTDDAVDAEALSDVLCKLASALQTMDPYACLHRYDDWWEHDGLHFHRGIIDFDGLFGLVNSPKRLLESTPPDEFVFVGISPEAGDWYIRYRVEWNESETGLHGQCAVILSPSCEEIIQELDKVSWLRHTNSDTYYTETIL